MPEIVQKAGSYHHRIAHGAEIVGSICSQSLLGVQGLFERRSNHFRIELIGLPLHWLQINWPQSLHLSISCLETNAEPSQKHFWAFR